MRKSDTKRSFLAIMVLGLLLLLAAPPTSFGQGRGRGRGNGRDRDWNNGWLRNRKCGKFVNCHDARDGRWDGRGPRGDRVGNIFRRNRNRNRSIYRNQNLTWRQRQALRWRRYQNR